MPVFFTNNNGKVNKCGKMERGDRPKTKVVENLDILSGSVVIWRSKCGKNCICNNQTSPKVSRADSYSLIIKKIRLNFAIFSDVAGSDVWG